jgi:hypothetical protein
LYARRQCAIVQPERDPRHADARVARKVHVQDVKAVAAIEEQPHLVTQVWIHPGSQPASPLTDPNCRPHTSTTHFARSCHSDGSRAYSTCSDTAHRARSAVVPVIGGCVGGRVPHTPTFAALYA